MTPIEEKIAQVNLYEKLQERLQMERLLLDGMPNRTDPSLSGVMAARRNTIMTLKMAMTSLEKKILS